MAVRYVITAYLFLFVINCQGQTKLIDSLKKNVAAEKDPGKKLDAIFSLCEQRQSLHTDTLAHYAEMAKEIALKTGDKSKITLADYFISNYLTKRGKLDTALRITDRYLARLNYQADKDVYVKFSLQRGQIFLKTERYKEALQEFYKMLDEAEQGGDDIIATNAKTNIGWVNMEMGQNEEALKWFYDALSSAQRLSTNDYTGVIFSNMAATYNELNRNDSAEFYINKAIDLDRTNGKNLSFLANALAIQADIFIDTKRKSQAEGPLNEVVKIRQQIGEPFYIVSDMTQLAIFYASNNEYEKGIDLCKQGIIMANQYGLTSKLPILYEALAENYKVAGMYKEYAETLSKILSLKDSIYEKNSEKALAEIQGKYDLQKKENTIIKQQFDLTKKNYLFYGLLALTVFALVVAYITFRGYRRKQELKMQLLLQDEKNLAAQAVIKAEENERKRISADLHDNLGVYAASIASNIDQISLSQSAEDNKMALEELRNNSQSIVLQLSDTIWALKKDALSLTTISDRLKLFIQRIMPSYPTVKIDVIERIGDDHLLQPSQAFHLFQIMKEGINNALKHSGCKQIFVIIGSDDGGNWKVSVEDDGRGLNNHRSLNGDGNGLSNMKDRSTESGWRIEWQANQPNGTCVVIQPGSD
ncbi:MAG TPA: tetratricopeptide repeat protein [Chitinophagaceae bacterium]